MGVQEEMYKELVGVEVNEMAVKCGGHKWAVEMYGEDAETAIVASWQNHQMAAKYVSGVL